MKPWFKLFLSASTLLAFTACTATNSQGATPTFLPRGAEVRGVFAGTTPCSPQARPLPQIPADANCEQMIWSLFLYQDPQTGAPTTYSLKSAYGLPKPNTNDLIGGGTAILMEGKWTIGTGTKTDPEATVYQLHSDKAENAVTFLRVSDDLLHVLDREKSLLVGNGAWSYTLSRVDHQTQAGETSGAQPDLPTRSPLPPMPEGSSVFGVFEGRTPCHAVALEAVKLSLFPGCLKVKIGLTLYQDKATGDPGTYLVVGTSAYREGSWKILQGWKDDANAVVYQLDLDEGAQPISLLQVDENHLFLLDRDMDLLVGNALFSYTLSRAEGVQ